MQIHSYDYTWKHIHNAKEVWENESAEIQKAPGIKPVIGLVITEQTC